MTLARGTDLTQQHETHLAIKAGRIMRGWTQAQMAELMAEFTGSDEWTEQRITAVENGRKKINHRDLRAFAEIQGYDVEFYWYGPPANRRGDFRDLGLANPGYATINGDATALRADYLNHDPRYVHAASEKCFDCIADPDAHVQPEDLIPGGGPIAGQLVIDLRDEALERWLQGNVA